MKRRFFAIAIALLLVLSLFGCAKPAANETSSVESTPEVVVAGGLDATPAAQMSGEGGLDIKILLEQDDDMKNNYTLIAVNDAAPFKDADGKAVSGVVVNTIGAKALIDWMLSDEAGQLISGYGVSQYGEALFTLSPDKAVSKAQIPEATDATRTIRLSTTTSVNDSGLLTYLLPMFEAKYGYTVEVSSAGTGKAIAAATMGNADLILVHSKSQEEKFVADGFAKVLEGYSTERLTFMYNYFVLVGPKDDPAKVAEAANVKDAFARIAEGKFPFVSRGDQSGTHTKEVSLWPESLGITTDAASVAAYSEWYLSSNAGMGVCLTMANELGAYVLSDKATFLAFEANGGAEG